MPRRTLAALAILLAAAPAAAQQPDIRPGLWEFALTAPATVKQTVCLTPAMVKDMKQMAAKGHPGSDCKSLDEKVTGARRAFKIQCTRPAFYQAHVVVTVDGPDRFSMTQDYVMEQGGKPQSGRMAMTYRRVGECK